MLDQIQKSMFAKYQRFTALAHPSAPLVKVNSAYMKHAASTLLHQLVLSIELGTVQTGIGKIDPARKFKCTTAARVMCVWQSDISSYFHRIHLVMPELQKYPTLENWSKMWRITSFFLLKKGLILIIFPLSLVSGILASHFWRETANQNILDQTKLSRVPLLISHCHLGHLKLRLQSL